MPKKGKKVVNATMQRKEIEIIVETYYAIQALRIESGNRIEAKVRDNTLTKIKSEELHGYVDGGMSKVETQIKKVIGKWVEQQSLYTQWMSRVAGIGPIISGGLMSMLDIHDEAGTLEEESKATKKPNLHVSRAAFSRLSVGGGVIGLIMGYGSLHVSGFLRAIGSLQ